ncbi:hypothetical protein [Nocardioides halotolerans]|uniref:hypothetical protein n=1 Tax=Nocardioides halotolerans TaxID=433660 RepID=UPI00068506CD|nr:hypothetical protein [Nocardioides halotolerans]
MSSATSDAERTPSDPAEAPSAGGSRLRRWRRHQEQAEPPQLGELDESQATEVVRRSAEISRDTTDDTTDEGTDVEAVSAETAEIDEPSDEGVVIEVQRWAEPAPTAEELAELEARREAAEAAAAAATERVIAQALANGMTDPDELPQVRRGLLRRKTGYYSPAPARPHVDTAAAEAAAARAQELTLPRKVRREIERATREMTEAAEAAHAARAAAEQAAVRHAEQTARAEAAATQAARGREAAEQAAREQAARARSEAQRRAVAEQLASETAEQMAVANADRIRVEREAREAAAAAEAAHLARGEAEEAALRASLEREAAEAHARAQAEAAAKALADRSAAEARAQELATALEEARAALLEQTQATVAAEQARRAAPPVVPPSPAAPAAPVAVTAPPAKPAPKPAAPRIQPEGVPELVEFRSPSSSAVITVLLGLAALASAATAVYEAYLDQLTTTPGIVASAVTLVLVVVVGRSKGSAGQVWLEHGVVHVDEGDSHRRFDLTTPNTKVEMVGRPGERRWKVLFLRKGMAPYEIDSRLVDPQPFVEAITPWRPGLGGS